MITGMHTLVYADDAEAARAFFRDVLGLGSVDTGDGWLIFRAPPTELAVHPTDGAAAHELTFMCDDLATTRAELETAGVEFTADVTDEGWGITTRLSVPGAGEMMLYEPRHPSPLFPDTAHDGAPA